MADANHLFNDIVDGRAHDIPAQHNKGRGDAPDATQRAKGGRKVSVSVVHHNNYHCKIGMGNILGRDPKKVKGD